MKTTLLIILVVIALIALGIIVSLLYVKQTENFTEDIFNLRDSEPNNIIDFNYSQYGHVTTSVEPNPLMDPTTQVLLGSFCFKSQGILKEEWKPEYNNPLEIIKNEISIRTSPNIHDITELITKQTIYDALTTDLNYFKTNNPDLYKLVTRITPNKDENLNLIETNVIAGPIYAIFIHHPYYVENNEEESKKYYKDIYFNNYNSKDFTPAYAIYNNGEFDIKQNTDVNTKNIKTQMLLLYPLYDKYKDELYNGKCSYYNIEEDGTSPSGKFKIKENDNIVFESKPSLAGISEMMRYFKSSSYYQNLLFCPKETCIDPELSEYTLKFKLSNDANCFIKCKGSLSSSNTDMKIVCGCASRFKDKNTDETNLIDTDSFDISETDEYDTRCKSNFNEEIEDDKYYIYGFAYKVNEDTTVNNELTRVLLSQTDITKLNDAINPTKISENGNSYLQLLNRCDQSLSDLNPQSSLST
jgi:hypothetical protein